MNPVSLVLRTDLENSVYVMTWLHWMHPIGFPNPGSSFFTYRPIAESVS